MNTTTKTTTNDEIDRNIDRNIDQLALWMRDHQPQSDWTPGQYQAYQDRLDALVRWLGVAQRRSRTRKPTP